LAVLPRLRGRLVLAGCLRLCRLRSRRLRLARAPLRLLLGRVPGLLELRRILDLLLRRRRVRRLRDLLRRDLDLRLAHRLLAPLCRHALLIGARLLHSRVTARTSAAGAATLARTTLSAAGTAPALPHRAEALAVRPTPAAALAGGAESFERSAAAPPCVLVAQARVTVTEAIGHDLALVDPDLDADA